MISLLPNKSTIEAEYEFFLVACNNALNELENIPKEDRDRHLNYMHDLESKLNTIKAVKNYYDIKNTLKGEEATLKKLRTELIYLQGMLRNENNMGFYKTRTVEIEEKIETIKQRTKSK